MAELGKNAAAATDAERLKLQARLREVTAAVRAEKIGEVAAEFEAIHDINRARAVGSVDVIIPAARLRPYLIDALERGMAREVERLGASHDGPVASSRSVQI